jgi:hypothetical protein
MVAHKKTLEAQSGERCHAAMAGEPMILEPGEEVAVGFMQERADDQLSRIFGDASVKEFKEERYWLEINGVRVASGRADRVVIGGTTAAVQDFKFGFREPDPAEVNSQLKFLAVVVALAYPHLTEVVAQVVSGPYGVSEAHYSVRDLAAAYNDVVATLARINDEHATFSPSIEACRYCPAAAICQATKDLILPVARLQHSALPDGERAGKLLDECELLERHIEQIRKYYAERLESDPAYSVPGWNMVPGPGRREVIDWRAARNRLEEFVEPEWLDGLMNFSIPAVEKMLAKSLGIKAKEASVKLAEILGELLNVKPGNLVLKRARGELGATALPHQLESFGSLARSARPAL